MTEWKIDDNIQLKKKKENEENNCGKLEKIIEWNRET